MKRANFSKARELKKLKLIVEQLPEDRRKLTEGLVADAAFQAEQLDKLRKHIDENGWSEEYQNGANQTGRKKSVEADMYVSLQKSYAAVIRQLTDLLPTVEGTNSVPGAEIMEFINGAR